MRKILALTLAVMLLLTLAACGSPDPTQPEKENPATPTDPTPTDPTPVQTPSASNPEDGFGFTLEGVTLYPGAALDVSQLPEPESVTQIPSCANQGTDNVYNFGTVEVTAFQTDAGEIIYSIYILDANTPTDLGLYLGDGQETVEGLYGTDYTTLDGQLVYAVGNSSLVILLDNDQVLSIDHRWEFD